MSMQRLIDFKNIHKGETIYVIGAGKSLQGLDWGLVRNEITFACNEHIFYIPFDPTYYYVMDYNPKIAWVNEAVLNMNTIRFCEPEYYQHKEFIAVPRLPRVGMTLYSDEGMGYASYSPVIMTEIALYMGAVKVVLLGVDLYIEGDSEHYWNKAVQKKDFLTRREQVFNNRMKTQFERFMRLNGQVVCANEQSLLVRKNILKYEEV